MLSKEKEYGLQPLDELMACFELKNSDLVDHSTCQLTHKQVQKARKGRGLTANIKNKVVLALNACVENKKFNMKDLFNY